MARRFGRNQKRHLREAAANANEARVMAEGLAKYAVERKARIESELEHTRRILGNNSSLLSPRMQALARPRRDTDRNLVLHKVRYISKIPRLADLDDITEAIADIPVPMLLADVRPGDPNRFDHMVHLRVRYNDGNWGYAISREAVRGTPAEELAIMISRELAPMIVGDLKKALR